MNRPTRRTFLKQAAAAGLAALKAGAAPEHIQEALNRFDALPHRVEGRAGPTASAEIVASQRLSGAMVDGTSETPSSARAPCSALCPVRYHVSAHGPYRAGRLPSDRAACP